jgi:hypothetical protein
MENAQKQLFGQKKKIGGHCELFIECSREEPKKLKKNKAYSSMIKIGNNSCGNFKTNDFF